MCKALLIARYESRAHPDSIVPARITPSIQHSSAGALGIRRVANHPKLGTGHYEGPQCLCMSPVRLHVKIRKLTFCTTDCGLMLIGSHGGCIQSRADRAESCRALIAVWMSGNKAKATAHQCKADSHAPWSQQATISAEQGQATQCFIVTSVKVFLHTIILNNSTTQ